MYLDSLALNFIIFYYTILAYQTSEILNDFSTRYVSKIITDVTLVNNQLTACYIGVKIIGFKNISIDFFLD